MEAIKVLDKGFVKLVDVYGDDNAICESARKSTNSKSKDNERLINYLMKHKHTSPFEFAEMKFHIKAPIIVARQWFRHRMASYNEISGRYTVFGEDYYIPSEDRIKLQDTVNRQSSGIEAPKEIQIEFVKDLVEHSKRGFELYDKYIQKGVAKEISRLFLGLNLYTEFYYKVDLNNLFKFLSLRNHSHAQWEIKEYAKTIEQSVQQYFPISYSAYDKHIIKVELFREFIMENMELFEEFIKSKNITL